MDEPDEPEGKYLVTGLRGTAEHQADDHNIFEGTEQVQHLVISPFISGLRIE